MKKEYLFNKAFLIDDNKIDSILNKKILEKNNISNKVYIFNNPVYGLYWIKKLITNQKIHEESPTAIFIDLIMPVMDGISLIEELNKLFIGFTNSITVVVISSSLSFKSKIKQLKDLNFKVHFITKPISMNKILDSL